MEKRKRQILYLLGSGLACLYIWVTLDFPLFFHNRARPFLLDTDFIAPFLRYVAGPMDCLASLVIQLYYYPWLGALAIFSILAAIYAATAAILRAFGRSSRLVSLLPAALGQLLLQQHITIFPLLSFAFSLGMAAAFIRTNSLPPALRLAIFAVLSVLTCYIAGGTALLFALVCALSALIIQKQRILAASYLVLGALIPYALGTALFQPDRTLQYFAAAPLEESSPDLHPLEIVWYALLPVSILGTVYAKTLRTKGLRALRLSCVLILAVICLVMVRNRFFVLSHKTLHFYAENAEWQKALDYAQRFPAEATIMTAHIVNHSLYHTGRLPHDMFDYPQFRYGQVLLLQDDKLDSFTRVANRRSDVFYHLGRIDQAERWAHEVLTTQGFLGHALSRLVSIHVLKDQPRAARVYAGMMQKTLTHHNQGTLLIAQFEKGELLAADPEINALRPLLPKADHIGEWTSQDILTQQLHDAPTNRMAFEFLMAYLLIKGDIIGFGQMVSMAEAFGHRELPRAYEEACVCYTLVAKQPPPNLSLKVRDETAMRFARFMDLYKRYESNQREAWEVLKPEFGNTYWFFDLFKRSGSLPPPDFEGKP